MQCFILAGGFATRLWPLTEKRAKPLLPLAGKPLITYVIEQIPKNLPITVSTNAMFKEPFEKWKKDINREVNILIEDTTHDDHKLGALGATAKWIRETNIDDDILLLTGDNYFGFNITDVIDEFKNNGNNVLFAAKEVKNFEEAKRFGVVLGQQQDNPHPIKKMVRWRATEFFEKPSTPTSKQISTGCIVLPKIILSTLVKYAKQHPDNIGGFLNYLLLNEKKEVDYLLFDTLWFDIGTFDAYLEATKALVGEHTVNSGNISSDSEIKGSVVIGHGSHVMKSILRNVVLFENCHITDCVLENCIIDNNSTLSHVDLTHKMIREGTILVPKRSLWEK